MCLPERSFEDYYNLLVYLNSNHHFQCSLPYERSLCVGITVFSMETVIVHLVFQAFITLGYFSHFSVERKTQPGLCYSLCRSSYRLIPYPQYASALEEKKVD